MKNHFELFGLKPVFGLDLDHLDRAYREIQTKVHPDRFAHAGDAERRASMQMTTQVNEAYRTLRSPVQRGKYLLALHGVDVGFESNTAMPREFLMEQMALRERLEEARDVAALSLLQDELAVETKHLESRIRDAIDTRHDHAGASDLVRKLMFLDRLGEEIGAAYEALES